MVENFDPKHAHRLETPERLRELPPTTVIDLLSLTGAETVVDYGAGTGVYTMPLAGALPHGHVVAVELQPELVAMLEAKLTPETRERVQVVQTAENQVPLPDGSVDRVLMVNVLHHVADDATALAEIVRLLRPGGLFVNVDWGAIDRPVGPGYDHVLDTETARAIIAGMGLREIAVHPPASLLRYHLVVVAEKPFAEG
ncbi:MAG: class I SAM-dependent methyltransferase [Thermoleophilia bacterium]